MADLKKANDIANHYIKEDQEKTLIKLSVGKPIRKSAKLTKQKRKIFLQEYYKTGNMATSALKVGVSRNAITYLMERDEEFSNAVKYVEDIHMDKLEEVSLNLASQPTREGFNDRKLLLMANRAKYNPKQEITVNQTINEGNYLPEIRKILSQYVSKKDTAIEATYTNINENNNLE